ENVEKRLPAWSALRADGSFVCCAYRKSNPDILMVQSAENRATESPAVCQIASKCDPFSRPRKLDAVLEEQDEDPASYDFSSEQIDKIIYNKDTNRAILRNLMENGLRDATGQLPGKSIIFARNHQHAVLMWQMFDEMYPQYGGRFCQVIDNYDPRAEQLIDDLKGGGSNSDLTIAISVDMLDTGIDIPEILNLVFAKPVRSPVKFWQ